VIQTSYTDADGKRRRSPRKAVEAVRDALVPPDDAQIFVAWDGEPTPVPDGAHELILESGEEIAFRGDRLPKVPLGYHTLDERFPVIAAPMRAPQPADRMWGVFLPLYALRTKRSPVLADLTDLRALTETFGLVGTLPLFAAFDDEPSPYSPVSRLFWNECYLDVGPVAGSDDDLVDWPTVAERKREKIRITTPPESWLAVHPHAEDYARFRAKEGGSSELHLAAQYLFDQQMQGIGPLYLDFPVGVHARGYDVSAFDVFATGVSVGAPPDGFFRGGQNWGFPPIDPTRSRATGHDYFRQCIATLAARAKVMRIDHVMGFHRLFLIPDGSDATDGVYVRYPAEELYAILTLEATRNDCIVVGEDLGTVPPAVRTAMRRHGLLRSFVYLFDPDGAPPRDALASLDTHDTATFAAWGEAELRPALRKLASSKASIVIVNLEDLWAERRAQNVPGDPSYPNWRRKASRTFESIRGDRVVNTLLDEVAELRRAS
jgi:4-alpha-glucanotransferase